MTTTAAAAAGAPRLAAFAGELRTAIGQGLDELSPMLLRDRDVDPADWSGLVELTKRRAPELLAQARGREPADNAARAAAAEMSLGSLSLTAVEDALRAGQSADDELLRRVIDAAEQYRLAIIDLEDVAETGARGRGAAATVTNEERVLDLTPAALEARRARAAATMSEAPPLPEVPPHAPLLVRLEHNLTPLEARRTSIEMYDEARRRMRLDGDGKPSVDLYDAIRIAERLKAGGMPFSSGLDHGQRILYGELDAPRVNDGIHRLIRLGMGPEDALRWSEQLVAGPLDERRVLDAAAAQMERGVTVNEAIPRAMRAVGKGRD